MAVKWELREMDKEFFRKELNDFVPDRIYDVHAHLYRTVFWKDDPDPPYYVKTSPPDITLEVYREQMSWLFPDREVHGMHFPLAFVPDTKPGNEWVAQEIKKDALARGQLLVRATDDPEWVRQEVKRLGFRGLKPFATYSSVPNKMEAEIPDFLPEPIMKVADREGWSITLHMMRFRCAADPSNQYWIRHYCEKYPRMQLILDHCARGFNPYHALEGLPKLTGLPNLWIDTSYICSALAVEAVLRIIGPERTFYGSDFCLPHTRCVNFGIGDTFTSIEDEAAKGLDGKPVKLVLAGLENLRAVKTACRMVGLTDKQVEDYFWGNAVELLGIK